MVHPSRWEHFNHGADIGVRGIAADWAGAFEQVALALTAVVTDPDRVAPLEGVDLECHAPDRELLCYEWLNRLVTEMAIRRMLFGRFSVTLEGGRLHATAWGEPVDPPRHQPAVEVKGATMTCLEGGHTPEGGCYLQTVVDV